MRIIAGEYRSRRLHTPPDAATTRPIPDRVKESLFGLLRGNCEGAAVFDGFAGTGALGIEALSRGASRCVFVEQNRAIVRILERNIADLGAGDRSEVLTADALGAGALSRCPRPVDLVFMDPPYPLVRDALGWERVRAQMSNLVARLSDGGFAVLRTPWPFLQGDTDAAEDDDPGGGQRRAPRAKRRGGGAGAHDDEAERVAAPSRVRPRDLPPVDLAIPGAAGPETHVYRSTAVHLYMRERSA